MKNPGFTENKRDQIFDVAKGLGIIFIIWGHTVCPIGSYLYEFHVPFFFIVAGYFHKQGEGFGRFVRKKSFRLLFPYLLFSVLAYLFYLTWHYIFQSGEAFDYRSVFKIFPYQGCVIAPLWFFVSLFEVATVYWLLKKWITNTGLLLAVAFGLTVFGYFLSPYRLNYFHFGSSLTMMFFYGLGNAVLKPLRKGLLAESVLKNLLFFLLFFFLFIAGSEYSHGVDINGNYIKASLPVFLINALSGSYLLLLFSAIVTIPTLGKVFAYIGANSLVVFAVHFPMFELARPFVNLLFVRDSTSWGIGLTVLCLIFSLLSAEILYRVLPGFLKTSPSDTKSIKQYHLRF